jgi:phage gpG-like protein
MTAHIEADFRQFGLLQSKIDKLIGRYGNELREGIGAILESSARYRISVTKLAPDGTPWPVWSHGYAERRPPGKSLLQDSGALLDATQYETRPDAVIVFQATEYAATHQFGDNRLVTIGAHKRRITEAFGKELKFPVFQSVGQHQQQRNIPARPSLGLGPADVEEIERLVDNVAQETFG